MIRLALTVTAVSMETADTLYLRSPSSTPYSECRNWSDSIQVGDRPEFEPLEPCPAIDAMVEILRDRSAKYLPPHDHKNGTTARTSRYFVSGTTPDGREVVVEWKRRMPCVRPF